MKRFICGTGTTLLLGFATASLADSISPSTYATTLDRGSSETIRKTVTVTRDAPTSGVLDVMFLIDTSGSMGGEIAAAKIAAADILNGLSAFGSLATGFGYYSEPGSKGVFQDLTGSKATTIAGINSWTTGFDGGGFGGDFPEEGINAVFEAASDASWRPASARFVLALGDATFKESDGRTLAGTLDALDANDVTFIGIDFGRLTGSSSGDIDPTVLADATGGSIATSSDTADEIVTAILSSVGESFVDYGEVSVGDLGAGLPGVGVSVACVSADSGVCDGAVAKGDFDRSSERTFAFDVTFSGLEEGTHEFDTLALVDGSRVASEFDRITVAEPGSGIPGGGSDDDGGSDDGGGSDDDGGDADPVLVPEPNPAALLILGLLGLVVTRHIRCAI